MEMLQLRKKLSLTRGNLSLILGVSEATIVRWEDAQKGKNAIAIDDHNLRLMETLYWLYKEVQKEECDIHLKYVCSLILCYSKSKKLIKEMKEMGLHWVTVGFMGAPSFEIIPIDFVFDDDTINAAMLKNENNRGSYRKLLKYIQLHGPKGLLYLADKTRIGISFS